MAIATRRLLSAMAIAAPFALVAPALTTPAWAGPPPNFVVAWAASAQGPYPIGNATAQPELGFAFPDAKKGATDQSFRMIVRPDIWGRQARIRLSNAFGTRRVTFDAVFIGLQAASSAIVPGTNRPVTFGGNASVTLPIGGSAVSDPVTLPFVLNPADRLLQDRRLAISFHVVGDSGPITWHAKGLTTSYIGPPHVAATTADEAEETFPFSTTSWYFLDAVDMIAPGGTRAVVAFGDSITDGTGSTINGFDRWPDVLGRRLHAQYGARFSMVNAGIGGNMILGPADYLQNPFAGGPAATERVDRDVATLSGVGTVIWLEGINDFGYANAEPETLARSVREVVARLRAKIPAVRVVMATLTSAFGSTNPGYGGADVEAKRQQFNQFIRTAGIFDGVIDFDPVTRDPATGEMKAMFQPGSSIGGLGDKLHPNRAGYLAMGLAIDTKVITGE